MNKRNKLIPEFYRLPPIMKTFDNDEMAMGFQGFSISWLGYAFKWCYPTGKIFKLVRDLNHHVDDPFTTLTIDEGNVVAYDDGMNAREYEPCMQFPTGPSFKKEK